LRVKCEIVNVLCAALAVSRAGRSGKYEVKVPHPASHHTSLSHPKIRTRDEEIWGEHGVDLCEAIGLVIDDISWL